MSSRSGPFLKDQDIMLTSRDVQLLLKHSRNAEPSDGTQDGAREEAVPAPGTNCIMWPAGAGKNGVAYGYIPMGMGRGPGEGEPLCIWRCCRRGLP